MATSVIMPALELAQETGKVIRWLKAPGDAVVKGEPLLEIETDKVTTEIEAPASSRSLAAPSATATMLLVATMVMSRPGRLISATPKGIV